jgi:peroxiredoxin
MKKWIFVFMVWVISRNGPSFAQVTYSWKSQNISLESRVELQSEERSNTFHLAGSGIVIDFATVGGMEGINGLAPSLDSYTESFGYSVNGKSREISDLDKLAAARIDGRKDGKSLVLFLLATRDYKKHFTCEIVFAESQRPIVEAIVKGIAYGAGAADNEIADSKKMDEDKSKDNLEPQQANRPDTEQEKQDNRNKPQRSDAAIGALADDFALKNLAGKTVRLSSFHGKTVLLDFWGTWCMPCVQSIPRLKELYKKYGGAGFEIISIANDANPDKWRNMVAAKGMTWTNVIDEDEKVCTLYQIKAFPSLFLVDTYGKFAAANPTDEEVEHYLQQTTDHDANQTGQDGDTKAGQQQEPNHLPNAGPVANTHLTGTLVQKLVWQLLSAYSPDGYYILDEYYKAPTSYDGQSNSGDDDFTAWIHGNSEQDVIKSLNTVVHEMDHGYTGRLYLKLLREANKPAGDGNYSAFYLGGGETRLVRHSDVFVTSEINAEYPKNLITSRYETYVHPSERDMGSQQNGVYGLLDEWNAYYNGTRTSFDLCNYYRDKRNNAAGWAEFFADYYSTFYAYLEFKSYILVYMMHAKKNYPLLYRGFMNNSDLLYALKRTDEIWTTLIDHFKVLKQQIMADLAAKGMDVKEKDGFLFIDGTGYSNFSETYNIFLQELRKPAYQETARSLGLKSADGPDF